MQLARQGFRPCKGTRKEKEKPRAKKSKQIEKKTQMLPKSNIDTYKRFVNSP